MLMTILTIPLLALVFIFGLIHTKSFPTKKFMAWFQSFSIRRSTTTTPHVSTIGKKKVKINSSTHNKDEVMKSVFATFDKNKDGFITKKELTESLKSMGMLMTEREVGEMVEKVDSNGDGLIDLDEFCELFFDYSMVINGESTSTSINGEDQEELKEAFDVFDGDKDGLITVEELGLVLSSLGLKEGKRLENCREMINKVDMDGDGMVNFLEFKTMMNKAAGKLLPLSMPQ
uniref:Putative calmodulin-like protein 3 n=1 Tax=Davidia involucrata TaxID=16924 RepID=A0A5B7BC52_DAVIN